MDVVSDIEFKGAVKISNTQQLNNYQSMVVLDEQGNVKTAPPPESNTAGEPQWFTGGPLNDTVSQTIINSNITASQNESFRVRVTIFAKILNGIHRLTAMREVEIIMTSENTDGADTNAIETKIIAHSGQYVNAQTDTKSRIYPHQLTAEGVIHNNYLKVKITNKTGYNILNYLYQIRVYKYEDYI